MSQNAKFLMVLFVCAFLLYSRSLGLHGIEYRDDEIFYYHSTQEMRQTGNYLSPTYFGEDRFQKPILFYWFILIAYQLLGPTWFAARVVSAVFAGLSVAISWWMAKDLFGRRVAWLSSVILMTMPMFFRHARNAVPDMAFNFFIILSIFSAMRFFAAPEKPFHRYLFFLACGLGFMIKGFAALIVPVITFIVASVLLRKKELLKKVNFPVGLAILAAVILPWFVVMLILHGQKYAHHMLVDETFHRVLSPREDANTWYLPFQSFLRNTRFYLQVMLSYFAPWSPVGFLAIPVAMRMTARNAPEREGLMWMFIWFFTAFIFFSFITVKIQHYMLVLSTPFAILTAYFFCRLNFGRAWQRWLEKGYFIFLVAVSIVAFAFLHIVLMGANSAWLAAYVPALVALLTVMIRSSSPVTPPAVMGLVMIFIFAQTGLLTASGITSLSTLQRVAGIIQKDGGQNDLVGVISNDIHEKELQVYFDRKVEVAANGFEPFVRQNINNLLSQPNQVYCLILEKDIAKYQDELNKYPLEKIAEDRIFRKRFHLDEGFLTAVVHLDRPRIDDYLKEKIVLLRKPHA